MSNLPTYACPDCGPDIGLIAYKTYQVHVDERGNTITDDDHYEEFVEVSSPFCRECGELAELIEIPEEAKDE